MAPLPHSKPLWRSRTAWFNSALAALSAGLTAWSMTTSTANLPLTLNTVLGMLAAVINIYLRLTTRTAIAPIIFRGPVQEGGLTFTGPTAIDGPVAGRDAVTEIPPSSVKEP